jgi:type IV pilus assembly protein PilM
MFLSEKTPLLAVDIGTHSVKMAQISGSKNKFELMNFSIMPLKEGCIVDGVVQQPDEVVEALEKMIKVEKIDTKYAVASIAGEAVIIKKIRVPLMTAEELAENIQHEAEQYIPFDIDDVSIDFQILDAKGGRSDEKQKEETMEILLVAVQKDIIESRIDLLYDVGLRPAIIDLDVFAMVNAFELGTDLNAREQEAIAVIDLGESFTHLNIMQDGLTAYTRDIPFGGSHCTNKLMSKFNLPYKEIAKLKFGEIPSEIKSEEVVEVIVNSFDKILNEVQKSFEFFSTTSNSQVDRVLLTGGGALISGVDGLFAHHLETPVEILNPMKGIKVNKRKFDQKTIDAMGPLSTVAIGLAARRFDYQ